MTHPVHKKKLCILFIIFEFEHLYAPIIPIAFHSVFSHNRQSSGYTTFDPTFVPPFTNFKHSPRSPSSAPRIRAQPVIDSIVLAPS